MANRAFMPSIAPIAFRRSLGLASLVALGVGVVIGSALTAGKRGFVEFSIPSGSINVIGPRAKAAGTLITIPLLTE